LVKPGGRLLYATCSLLVEENEAQIERFLDRNKDFVALPDYFSNFELDPELVKIDGSQLRTFPAKTGTDGFFVTVMERVSTGE